MNRRNVALRDHYYIAQYIITVRETIASSDDAHQAPCSQPHRTAYVSSGIHIPQAIHHDSRHSLTSLFLLSLHDNHEPVFATMRHINTRFSWSLLPSLSSATIIRPSPNPALSPDPAYIQSPPQPRLNRDTHSSLLEVDPPGHGVINNLITRWLMSFIGSLSSVEVRLLIQRC